jgi:hypothetical protein
MLHSPNGFQFKEWSSFLFLRHHFSNNRCENLKAYSLLSIPTAFPETQRRALQSSPFLLRISSNSTGEDSSLLGLTSCQLMNRFLL